MTNPIEDGEGRPTFQGYLASVGSAAGYGFGTYFAFLVIRDGVPPMTATFFSLVFGLLIMAVLFPRPALIDLKLAPLRGWVVVSMSGLASAFGVTSFIPVARSGIGGDCVPRRRGQSPRGDHHDAHLLAAARTGL